MSISPVVAASPSGTLAAGVATDVDLAVRGASRVTVVLKNTGGSNAIGTVVVQKSPLGALFGTDAALGAAIGAVAAGAAALIELDGAPLETLRLTLTSAGGTTYAIEVRGH